MSCRVTATRQLHLLIVSALAWLLLQGLQLFLLNCLTKKLDFKDSNHIFQLGLVNFKTDECI